MDWELPHKRFNPLTGDWILVSPHRAKRPWQGQKEQKSSLELPEFDENCYLCPGNTRSQGQKNPEYRQSFVFTNDFSALLKDTSPQSFKEGDLFQAESESGICRVICFSPKHNLTLARMQKQDIVPVIELWQKEYQELGSRNDIEYVQIFENRGAVMGCSNPHPHGQIWANRSLPELVKKEDSRQHNYYRDHNSCLLCDYLQAELDKKERIVLETDHFAALVPFWAIWPYEILLLPKKHVASLSDLNKEQIEDFASILKKMGSRYDNLFECSFPYSMGIHQKPTHNKDKTSEHCWHLHLHYFPPLLRSATVKKFMVGYEMLATAQRDITAESAAARLRDLSDIHYLDR